MGPRAVAEAQGATDRGSGLRDVRAGPEVDLLVLHRPPEPLDDIAQRCARSVVVSPGALAVHADRDLGVLQDLDELEAGELRALVGVEDLRPAVAAERLIQGLDARCPPTA
jgi:hypothetical protein